MKKILLTRGYYTLVDDADFLELSGIKFHANGKPGNIYAAVGDTLNGKRIKRKLHHILFGCVPGLRIDHRNGDSLDNRRLNLRLASSQNNSRNMRKWKTGATSNYKGVCWHKRDKKWQVNIKPSAGVPQITTGSFKSELAAADAYDRAAIKYHGDFANLNFPIEN